MQNVKFTLSQITFWTSWTIFYHKPILHSTTIVHIKKIFPNRWFSNGLYLYCLLMLKKPERFRTMKTKFPINVCFSISHSLPPLQQNSFYSILGFTFQVQTHSTSRFFIVKLSNWFLIYGKSKFTSGKICLWNYQFSLWMKTKHTNKELS